MGATQINLRLPPDQLVRLDMWIASLPDPKPTRPEAIRRALEAVIVLSGLERGNRAAPAPKAVARMKGAAAAR